MYSLRRCFFAAFALNVLGCFINHIVISFTFLRLGVE